VMDAAALFYPESRFGGFTGIDGTVAFYVRVNALLTRASEVLDVGCGRGAFLEDPVPVRRELRRLQGKCRRLVGIDVDAAARAHPALDEFRLIEGRRWPVEDAAVDLCVADGVLEHVEDPALFFAECRRVLKPGGYLCLRTSNALSYVGLLSWLVPNRCHAAVLRRVQPGRKVEDIFPTFYRCNTRAGIRRRLQTNGFEHCVYGYEAEPSYLSSSLLLYALGVLHQRLGPGAAKPTLFAFARKREQAAPADPADLQLPAYA